MYERVWGQKYEIDFDFNLDDAGHLGSCDWLAGGQTSGSTPRLTYTEDISLISWIIKAGTERVDLRCVTRWIMKWRIILLRIA